MVSRSVILIILCIVALCLIYEFMPKCEPRRFDAPKSIVKRDNESYIVLSLSDDGVARFFAVPKEELDLARPINYNSFIYYFNGNGVFKKNIGDESVSVRLQDDSDEKRFVTNIRKNRYRLVHSEPNYTFKSSVTPFSREDYDLVVRTAN